MTKQEGAEWQRMLDVTAQSDAVHRVEGFDSTTLHKHRGNTQHMPLRSGSVFCSLRRISLMAVEA